jgi:hypothetical protein
MNSRLETIREICIRNELDFWDVMRIYTKYSNKVYIKNYKKGDNRLQYGHPELEQKVMDLTERYFDIRKWKELRKER